VATRFGAYEILYELKTGGMGAVLLGRRRGLGTFEQLVAIKTILAGYAQAPAVRAMFLDEAALLARLNHPAIATVHDFGEQGGTLYMVMEYVAGIPFRDVMQHGLPPGVAARAIAEACRGVHAAHELRDLSGNPLGVVHRDISPDNLMFGFDGHIKVIDFGIALVKNRQAPVTEFGTVKGKPPYMSPEQVKNEAIDPRSDVFSLAVVLWELLTGTGLFEGDSIYAIARSVEHQQIRPPSQVLGAPLPLGLDAAVMNALDRDLSRRTQTAAAFAEQLEQVIQTAGDETLEAWADRVLEDARIAHRAWLASVVAGRDAPRPIGRPTGSVTALAPPIGKASTMVAPIAPAVVPTSESPPDPGASTRCPTTSSTCRRRGAWRFPSCSARSCSRWSAAASRSCAVRACRRYRATRPWRRAMRARSTTRSRAIAMWRTPRRPTSPTMRRSTRRSTRAATRSARRATPDARSPAMRRSRRRRRARSTRPRRASAR
jgi:serine/threonine protein kinase